MANQSPPPLLLASSSPYRRELLSRLGLAFSHHSPDIDETPEPKEPIPGLCRRLAGAKAAALASRFPAHTLIGCDQSAAVDGRQLHKPGTRARAVEQLKLLSGRTVGFYTAVAVLDSATGEASSALDVTEVRMRPLSESEIGRYLDLEQPFDCAGSFKAEGLGIALFEKIASEDPTALIGLPLIALSGLLRERGYPLP